VYTSASREGPALGAAILAGVAAGVYPSVPEACDRLVRPGARQSPDAKAREEYENYFRIYKGLYPALKDHYHALSAL